VVVDDHWEWFRRVAAARRERETAPALPVIERCVTEARQAARGGADAEMARLGDRLEALLTFVTRFETGVDMFVRGDARAIEGLFAALSALEPASADRLWALLGELSSAEMAGALDALSRLSPSAARRLVGLADQPVLQKLIGMR
jgi:ubiquinone biosynthesis protein UbiJ